jgi:cytochrome c oxidase cbb3-type subunit I/II
MPAYPWLFTQDIDKETIPNRINALRTVGVPYAEGYEDIAVQDLEAQAEQITQGLRENGFDQIEGIQITSDKKIIALIAYMQRLGIDIKGERNPWEDLPSSNQFQANIEPQQEN